MRVAALVPAYQAANHLGEVLMALAQLSPAPDILVVDDGSRDSTADVARQFGARVISFAANRGKGHALIAGFAALADYEGVVTLDADGQHPPECFRAFVDAADAGAALVLGRRERTPNMPIGRRVANGFSSQWATFLAGQTVSDSQCGYRLYTRDVIRRTPITPGRYEFETEIAIRAARLGFRIDEVDIPTVYGEEQSQIRAFRDVPRIFGTYLRLTLEAIAPPHAMREARKIPS